MKIAVTFTDQEPQYGQVIGEETYIIPVDDAFIPIKVKERIDRGIMPKITIVKN